MGRGCCRKRFRNEDMCVWSKAVIIGEAASPARLMDGVVRKVLAREEFVVGGRRECGLRRSL